MRELVSSSLTVRNSFLDAVQTKLLHEPPSGFGLTSTCCSYDINMECPALIRETFFYFV